MTAAAREMAVMELRSLSWESRNWEEPKMQIQ